MSGQKPNIWAEEFEKADYTKKIAEYYGNIFEWDVRYKSLDSFITTLQRQLPICLRIRGSSETLEDCVCAVQKLGNSLAEIAQDALLTVLTEVNSEGSHNVLVHQVQWLKNANQQSLVEAWQINVPQKALNLPQVKPFYNDIIEKINLGFMTRQESVSMIPVFLLDIAPTHSILDMCAAPGSKTTQALEMLSRHGDKSNSGFIIANDVSYQRQWVMIHQCGRLASNLEHLIVTKHCGMSFPLGMQFDRIICDVPCTGDGTLRKSMDLWKRWKSSEAFHMHRQQVGILKHALRCLRPGGRLVYSTCSMNPIENEAVLLHCLAPLSEEYSIVESASNIPELHYVPGVEKWKVMDDNLKWYTSFDEIEEERATRLRITESMFPPSESVIQNIAIKNSIRILPHFQNTGGFFIAVIQRAPQGDGNETSRRVKAHKKPHFIEIAPRNKEILEKRLGLCSTFPWETLLQRPDEGKRLKVFRMVREAAAFIARNPSLNYQHVGMKVFEIRLDGSDSVTVYHEGVDIIKPYLPAEKIIQMQPSEVHRMLSTPSSSVKDISEQDLLYDKLENVRDFFMASTITASGQHIDVAFNWNRFLGCWKASIGDLEEKLLLESLSSKSA
ncbi:hypothetical protein XU18_1119 [Perkinsela sp. CCAP 1560/4]|nr:hypothetical protein XU18_1119 [Perkinsela sp. CCAP 1560/4]|eukprot:KNH08354.1 hypothetical protein XU18_1119 [Perkinsela sp. CCAP 1560/4]